ncbi:MAG: 50S ribosomal protein L25/general stress protein Ctc [Bacteroidota bacterium]|nr:50S ribosomal protein L25/general stress protein Ctc [Bacteroidota bacterium]
MKAVALFGNKRETTGKRGSKDLRNTGKVPCVLYGGDQKEPLHFYMYASDFKDIVYTPNTYKAKLDVDGEIYNAIIQQVQYHPVNDTIIHVDFLAVSDDKPVTMQIPVNITGNSPGVRAGGKMVKKIRKMTLRGLIKDFPDFVEVKIDALELGKSIKVQDINLPGITILDAPANAIVSVTVTRSTKQEAAATPGK